MNPNFIRFYHPRHFLFPPPPRVSISGAGGVTTIGLDIQSAFRQMPVALVVIRDEEVLLGQRVHRGVPGNRGPGRWSDCSVQRGRPLPLFRKKIGPLAEKG